MSRFANRVIAITGAYGGFGRAMVQRIMGEGGTVIAIGRRKEELLQLQSKSNESGVTNLTTGVASHTAATPQCEIVCADIATEKGQNEVVDALKQLHADSLVNNAGIFKENLCTEFGRDEYDSIMNVNCTAPLFITQGICKHWIAQQQLHQTSKSLYTVVNISSCASLSPLKGHLVYGLSKAAMDYWTKHFALELGAQNIQINSINATIVNSEMGTGKRGYWGNALRRQWALDRIAMGRFGEVDEVVSLTAYLLSNECRFVNGVNVPLEGGLLCGANNCGNDGVLDNIDADYVTDAELNALQTEIDHIRQLRLHKQS